MVERNTLRLLCFACLELEQYIFGRKNENDKNINIIRVIKKLIEKSFPVLCDRVLIQEVSFTYSSG